MVVQVQENYPDGKVQLNDGDAVGSLDEKLGLPLEFVRIIIDKGLFNKDVIYIFPPAIAGG
jgi:hypothetical protein